MDRNSIHYEELIFLKDQQSVDVEIDFWIDDCGYNAKKLAYSNNKVFLMNYPWNRRVRKHNNIIRVNNWGEIIKILKNWNIFLS